ncbi:MAG: NosD domain-containing protein [Candidatus Hodarchaeota archaeon]
MLIIIPLVNIFPEYSWDHNIQIEPNFAIINHKSQNLIHNSQHRRHTKLNQYKEHGPIFINGDTDFNRSVRVENWLGNGTPQNPFVIKGLRITGLPGSSLIKIWNTDLHFQITNCFLDGGYYGIHLSYAPNFHISENIVVNNMRSGIFIGNHSRSSSSFPKYGNISNNIVSHNRENGIQLYYYFGNGSICNNNISLNYGYGVLIEGNVGENVVSWNDFIGNNQGNSSQAYDANGLKDVFEYNHWNDWTSPDVNTDGIVDIPYAIDGFANNSDPYPLVFSFISYHEIPLKTGIQLDLSSITRLGFLLLFIGLIVILILKQKKES